MTLPIKGNLKIERTATFLEYDNGNSGATPTVDWNKGNKQKITLNAATVTFAFTAPPGPCNLILKLIQDVTGGRAGVWPASVKWPGGLTPTLSTGASDVDVAAFYYDGTDYFSVVSLDFS